MGMGRKVRAYTPIGHRITTLAKRQRELAKVLGVSQQTVSKKLRGDTAIMLSDLEKLAGHYKVPLSYFTQEEPVSPELAAAWERVREGAGPIQDAVVLLTKLSPIDLERVHEITRVIAGAPAAAPARPRRVSSREPARRAAEEAPPYGEK